MGYLFTPEERRNDNAERRVLRSLQTKRGELKVVNAAFPKMDRVPQGGKSEGRLTPVIADQGKSDDTVPGGVRVRGACQFEDVCKNFDGYSVDGGLGVLPASENYLCAREECGQFADLTLDGQI